MCDGIYNAGQLPLDERSLQLRERQRSSAVGPDNHLTLCVFAADLLSQPVVVPPSGCSVVAPASINSASRSSMLLLHSTVSALTSLHTVHLKRSSLK